MNANTTPKPWYLLTVLLVLAVLAGACGDDDSASDQGTGSVPEAVDDAALAEAIRIDAAVDARIADATDYTGINEPVPVAAGDNIRTDTTGFAEIAYFDGSLTRLDINTDFTVVELVDNAGDSVIRTEMGIGRTWHRVQTLSGNDTYEVETSVATAVVRGTAFIIECTPDACTFTVLEGTIELELPDGTTITLEAGQTITIETDTAPGEPTTITADPFDDPWLTRNNQLDTQQGNDDLMANAAAPNGGDNDAGAGGSGEYTVDVSATGVPLFGDVDFSASVVLRGACDGANDCEIVFLAPNDGPLATGFPLLQDFPLEPTGDGYTWSSTEPTIEGSCGGGTRVNEGQLTIGPAGLTGMWNFVADGPCPTNTSFTFEPGTWNPPVPVDCVMNGTATVGADVTQFVDEPVTRREYNGPSGSGYSFGYGAFGDPLELSVGPDSVSFGPGMPATSVNDGGTYDFDPDGMGATVVDDRPGQLDTPAIGIDVVIVCAPAG